MYILAGCKSDNECPILEACYNRECLDPCQFEKCGVNAECSVRNHRASCKCRQGYKGNPYELCRQYECLSDPECADYLACRNEKCVDPCEDCSINADCTARNHRAICECRVGYTGNPYGSVCSKSKSFLFPHLTIYLKGNLTFKHVFPPQFQYLKWNAQQIGIVQAESHAWMRNAKTPVKQLTHVPQMPSVLSTTPFLSVPCLAHVYQVLLEKEMNAVTKYVSSNDNFFI